MRSSVRKYTMIMGVFLIFCMIAPAYVNAATGETTVTETIDLPSASDSNDEEVNIANGTIEFNVNSWSPLPTGIFVGGTVKESLMRMNELSEGGWSEFVVATRMRFQQDYVSTGASKFVVRLPGSFTTDNIAFMMSVDLYVYKCPAGTFDLQLTGDAGPGFGDVAIITDQDNIVVVERGLADITNHYLFPAVPFSMNPSDNSYISGDRLYTQIYAPLVTTVDYIFLMRIIYDDAGGNPYDMFWSASDLCSDDILDTKFAYYFQPDIDTYVYRYKDVSADAGWSFVFQRAYDGRVTFYDDYFETGEMLQFSRLLTATTPTINGSLNIIIEFNSPTDDSLNYTLACYQGHHYAWDPGWISSPPSYLLNPDYWTSWIDSAHGVGEADQYIIASTGANISMTHDFDIGSVYYYVISVVLRFNEPGRFHFYLYEDSAANTNTLDPATDITDFVMNNWVVHTDAYGVHPIPAPISATDADQWHHIVQGLFFSFGATITVSKLTINQTWISPVQNQGPDYWSGLGSWFSENWVDIGAWLCVLVGGTLVITGVGAGFGGALIATGIGMFLYNHVSEIRDSVNGFVQGVVDVLSTIGSWLWKIGEFIWKVLSWVVDFLVANGGTILAILIYFLAMIVPILIIYFTVKMMTIFMKIAKGDLEGAAADIKQMISTVKSGVDEAKGVIGR